MRSLVPRRWREDAEHPLTTFQREMNRLMESFLGTSPFPEAKGEWVPALDVAETENEIVVKAEVPGIDKKDIRLRAPPRQFQPHHHIADRHRPRQGRSGIQERRTHHTPAENRRDESPQDFGERRSMKTAGGFADSALPANPPDDTSTENAVLQRRSITLRHSQECSFFFDLPQKNFYGKEEQ